MGIVLDYEVVRTGDKVLVDKVKLRKWFWIHRAAVKAMEERWDIEAGYYSDRIAELKEEVDNLTFRGPES